MAGRCGAVGGTPAPLSWIADTVLGALGALGVEATAPQLCGRCFLSLRDVVAALDELERRGFVEPVGRRWRATDAGRADGRPARADPAAAAARLNRDGGRLIDRRVRVARASGNAAPPV